MNKWLKRLLIADFFFIFSAGMLLPIYAIFVEQIGGDILDASGAWFVFTLTAGILMLLLGKWEDSNKHYSKMLFGGYILRTFAFFSYIFVDTTLKLFLIQLVIGISAAISTPAYDALYSKHLDKGKFASEWGMWEAMASIVSAGAALIGGLIVTYFGFNVLFTLMGFSGILGIGLAAKLMKLER